MNPLDYLLPQPLFDLPLEKREAFESLIASPPPGSQIDYQLPFPKWQFLSYVCATRDLVLHGSQNADIDVVEPRRARDVRAFSAQDAIYASTDGIWVIYFAIIDRRKFSPLSLFNSCLKIQISPDQVMGPLYFFSITHSALVRKPWCDGVIYILPRANFIQEAPQKISGVDVIFPHWVSSMPSSPVFKLQVKPEDFPFLDQVHGHDDEKLSRLSAADPGGFPWPEAWIL